MTNLATMFGAPFMQQAAVALIMIGVCASVVGVALNLRELEFVSDGLVHAVFPGVVIGFVAGGSEGVYLGALLAALAATIVLTIAAHRGVGEDATTAVLLSGAFALGIVIISRSSNYATGLEQLLFGQLLTVGPADLIAIAVLGGAALVTVAVTWKEQTFLSFDPSGAEATGMRLLAYELALNLAIAAIVVAASRAVGNLLVLALLIVPAAIGRLLSRRLALIVAIAAAAAVLTSLGGLTVGYWLSVDARLAISPSAVLVLVLVGTYLVIAGATSLVTRVGRRRGQRDAAHTAPAAVEARA